MSSPEETANQNRGGVSRGKDKGVPGDILTYKQGQRQECRAGLLEWRERV